MPADAFGEFQNGYLLRVADVNRQMLVGVNQLVDAVNQVGHVAEASRLLPIAVHGERLAGQRLMNEVGQRPAVVEPHARAIGVEDAHDPGIHALRAMVGHGHGLGEALGFIVHAPRTDGIHVAPVVF